MLDFLAMCLYPDGGRNVVMDTKSLLILCLVAILGVGAFVAFKTGAFAPAVEDAPLVNTYWRLAELNGQAYVMSDNAAREPHFILQTDNNRMVGFSGCNRMTGSYLLVGKKLTFPDNIAMTRMACLNGTDVEQAYSEALRSTTGWEIRGTTLKLRDRNGKVVGTFEQTLMQ
jgi:heat shock protein HslJ